MKCAINTLIAQPILFEFTQPIDTVVSGYGRQAKRAPVPEATIDEDSEFNCLEGEVRTSRE